MRVLLVLLLLANALFFGWSQGWLDGAVGIPAHGDREPQRMLRQQHPERLTLLPPQQVAALQASECIELGPVHGDAAALQTVMRNAGVADSEWSLRADAPSGGWGLATIKLKSRDFQNRKEETYKKMHIAFTPLPGYPQEQPSLLLSRHDSKEAAEAALAALSARGLQGLRVLALPPAADAADAQWLHFDAADGLRQQQLLALSVPELKGSAVRACAAAPAAPASPTALTPPASAASR
ncbi:MAG TPA: hypothetical protein VGE47_01675 [Burkholderiaceae bacterium]